MKIASLIDGAFFMNKEIFKAGKHIDNAGNSQEFTEQDVAAIAEAYNTTVHEAPIVVGHPKLDGPAYGWVKSLSANNGSLVAEFSELEPAFAELVQSKRYKKVSASFYPPTSPANPTPGQWYLKHLGFLGATPPAIKGLAEINFAEDDTVVSIEFGEASNHAFDYVGRMFRNFREWLIAKEGNAVAEEVVPNYMLDGIKELTTYQDHTVEQSAFSDLNENPLKHVITHDFNKETSMSQEDQATIAAEKARADAAEKKLADFEKAQADKERADSHTANTDFAESLVTAGTLKPADKALVVQALDFAEYPAEQSVDFGEGAAQKTLATALREFFKTLPQAIEFGEVATAANAVSATGISVDFADANPDALSHHQRASALSKKEGISYEEAARRTI